MLQGAFLSVLVPLFSHRNFRNARNIIGAFISEVRANKHFWWSIDRSYVSDCKDPMLAKGWKPAWIVEHRRASFLNGMSPFEEFLQKGMDEFSSGVSLYGTISSSSISQFIRPYRWGNMPAMDVLNLPKNEKDSTTDFSLAFVGKNRIY